jgi:hypothetical protein
MIVDDAERLHPLVGDGRSDKFEAAALQFLRSCETFSESGVIANQLPITKDGRAFRDGPAE